MSLEIMLVILGLSVSLIMLGFFRIWPHLVCMRYYIQKSTNPEHDGFEIVITRFFKPDIKWAIYETLDEAVDELCRLQEEEMKKYQ